ncbi:MAG: hypothetical protein JTT11_07655, partial [Candidatus Brockarchaeota archaeon]|nr:hypothetical protein [Candidatus Brockarchaeota archaeon]
ASRKMEPLELPSASETPQDGAGLIKGGGHPSRRRRLPCPKLPNETWEEYVKRHQKLRNPKARDEKRKPVQVELPTRYES